MALYHDRYLSKLKSLSPVQGRDIAVLGCSFGVECRGLIDAGANSVTGFDLDPRIGKDFVHPRVTYRRLSILHTEQPSGAFDIVYSAAVFEHIHDLPGAMSEAARICKPGGLIFILSSPLWYAPYGNHMISMLEPLPWCHLLYTPSELRRKISAIDPALGENGARLDDIVDRIHDPTYFNRLPPSNYTEAACQLRDVTVSQNALWPVAVSAEYLETYLPLCLSKGYVERDLMAGAHFFCGHKK